MSKTGLFISFEGGEGGGKTTQINKLAEHLASLKRNVVTTREPGGTAEGERIRSLIVQRDGGEWNAMSECLLLFAARSMHVEKVIRPALADGAVVISDRFTDSTRAYQGYGRGMKLDDIESLNKTVLGDFAPDLTFILDIAPNDGLARSKRRLAAEQFGLNQTEDRFENLALEFHAKLREGFLAIAKKEPKRCHVIKASGTIDDVAAEIKKIVMERLGHGSVR